MAKKTSKSPKTPKGKGEKKGKTVKVKGLVFKGKWPK